MTRSSEELGRLFIEDQDRNKSGPSPTLCAEDYTATINLNPPIDLAGFDQFGRMFYSAFPDLYHDIQESFGTDDRAVVRFILRGTHTAPFMGIPASGKSISVPGMVVLHIGDGRVRKLHAIFDQMSMMRQLGAIPEEMRLQ